MSKPTIVIETSERIICLNEHCGEEIHRHRTAMNIDQRTGVQIIKAKCQNCGTFYRITRPFAAGAWGAPKIEIITDAKLHAQFDARIEAVGSIQKKDLPPVRAAV